MAVAKVVLPFLGIVLFTGAGPEAPHQVKEAVDRQVRFTDPSGAKSIRVDNVFGSVEVVGAAVEAAQVTGVKWIRADSEEKMAAARRDVALEVSESQNTVDITVNGPFRHRNCDCDFNWDDAGYVVRYDLKIRVPSEVDVLVKTVNEGEVTLKGLKGRLEARNVNGSIQLERVSGTVDATTVNGGIRASFSGNPGSPCRFRTVNGDVQLAFDSGLSADFTVKTLNGEVRTDYAVTALPPKAVEGRRENGRYVYRSNRGQSVRVGAGGPEVSLETLNGDIVIAHAE